ncbi:unnamed protein product [Durusdinium trenchii]|uniref:Uncharacterized protein n=2 Tax=Durusdinium trenchii TaxID=1381693 RepID=A0ABP0JTF0_9DINO
MQAVDASRMAAIVADIMDGIQDEMLTAMSSHMRSAAAACADVCAARLRTLQTALSRHLDEARRQQIELGCGAAAPLTTTSLATQQALDLPSLGGYVALSPEAERVVGRVRSAVGRSGRSFEEVFRGFCRSGGRGATTMDRADLARVLSTFEPDIDPEVVARLWRLTVPDGAQGLDFNSFCTWFCPGGRTLSGHGSVLTPMGGLSESQMLSQLLEKSSMSRSPSGGGLGHPSSPLSASMPNLCHFGLDQALPLSPGARLSSTLTPEQLLATEWRQERPRSAWPTWPALEAGCAQPPPARLSPLLQDDFPTVACLSRLQGYLAARGFTLNNAFVLYDTHMEQAVTQEGFVSAIEHHGFPLSRAEAEAIFNRLARRKSNQVLALYFEDLQSCMASLPNPLPQVQWGKDLIKSVDKITRGQGTPLETLFRHLGTDSVAELDVRAILSRYSPLSAPQWANLLPLLDKNPDGTVPWQFVLRWAGLDCQLNGAAPASPPLPAVPAAPVPAPAAPALAPPVPPLANRPATAPSLPVGPTSSLSPPAPPPRSPPVPTVPTVSTSRPSVPALLTSPPPPGPSGIPLAPVSAGPPPLPPTHMPGPPPPPTPLAPASCLGRGPFPPSVSAWGRS